jgi:hypothetical protein
MHDSGLPRRGAWHVGQMAHFVTIIISLAMSVIILVALLPSESDAARPSPRGKLPLTFANPPGSSPRRSLRLPGLMLVDRSDESDLVARVATWRDVCALQRVWRSPHPRNGYEHIPHLYVSRSFGECGPAAVCSKVGLHYIQDQQQLFGTAT